MTTKLKPIGIAALALGLSGFTLGTTPVHARQSDQQAQPDNTANNKDSNKSATTADQQKESPADRELAKKIRKSIASDSSLSTYAHNIKVIVRDGMVTLKGPVHTEDEKSAIGSKASDIAGADKVQNQLTVKS